MSKTKIIHHNFPEDQYYKEETEKSQIVLHHTISGDGVEGDLNWWEKTPENVATCIIIARNGDIHTLFSSRHWAHHLGVKMEVFRKINLNPYGANKKLNKGAIGLEFDSWGGLEKVGSKFYSHGNNIPIERVVDYGYDIRGYRYYEKYTEEQIQSMKVALYHWNKKYNIPLDYNKDMWEFNKDALQGKAGIWSHVSYRPDKSDCHPFPPLIKTLKSLTD